MKVIYPGSFDPITIGHLDIIKRCSSKFDQVIIGVLNNTQKRAFFSLEERVTMIQKSTSGLKNVQVLSFSGLLINFARENRCELIIRGLRAVSDYEYEMQLANLNNKLNPQIETLFFVAKGEYSYLSSSIVKEIAVFGGDFSSFVPKNVHELMLYKLKGGKQGGFDTID